MALAGSGGAWYRLIRQPAPRQPALPPDSALVASQSGAGGPGITLGVGYDITDDPVLNLSSPSGARITSALHAAKIALLRFGADNADNYDWESGCIYGNDGRSECGYSFDHFLQLAAAVGARPLIVVNGEIDAPQQAARMVAYYWAHCVSARMAQGLGAGRCPTPYWEIGYAPANWRHYAIPLAARRTHDVQTIQPDQYAALVISYAAAMLQAMPPWAQLQIVADEWITGATDQSWVVLAHVRAIDVRYASLSYVPGNAQPTAHAVISALQNDKVTGRPGIDTRLDDSRSSLAQFSDGAGIGIIVGQWTIDAYDREGEPAIYSGYIQAIYAAELLAHLWQDANAGGANPLIGAVQYPIIGTSQEPFDPATGASRPAVAVYRLVDGHLGTFPRTVTLGAALSRQGIVAAAATSGTGATSVLLVNTDSRRAVTVSVQGLVSGSCRMWWLVPDAHSTTGVSAARQRAVSAAQITLPPWAIAVVQPSH